MLLTTLLQDARFALRQLAKRPVFSALVVATLGLGIGANAAMFSILDAVLLRPLSFREPDRLVLVLGAVRGLGLSDLWLSGPEYRPRRSRRSRSSARAT